MTQDPDTQHPPGPMPVDTPASHRAAPLPQDIVAEGPFGKMLEPVLRSVCEGRLSEVSWFRTDWQRGGAATGYATYKDDDGNEQQAVVKLPIPPCELQWMRTLQDADDVVPRLYASGQMLGGYDMAWVVMERLPHGPLGSAWGGAEFGLLVHAVGRFYEAAKDIPTTTLHDHRDWNAIYDHARQSVRASALREPQRWNKALKRAHKKYKEWVTIWDDRPMTYWCHGDLHLGNAMTRTEPPQGPAVLFDFAKVCVSHWVQDGVYLEHLYWGRPGELDGHKLCKELAHHRKQLGLQVDKGWSDLANAKRALLAMSVPAKLDVDGNAQYVHGALEVLERAVG